VDARHPSASTSPFLVLHYSIVNSFVIWISSFVIPLLRWPRTTIDSHADRLYTCVHSPRFHQPSPELYQRRAILFPRLKGTPMKNPTAPHLSRTERRARHHARQTQCLPNIHQNPPPDTDLAGDRAALLRPLGVRLKGLEVRGWRTSRLRLGFSRNEPSTQHPANILCDFTPDLLMPDRSSLRSTRMDGFNNDLPTTRAYCLTFRHFCVTICQVLFTIDRGQWLPAAC
jgi:hypothetical protein